MIASVALCGDVNPAPTVTGWDVESWQVSGSGGSDPFTHVIYKRVCQTGDPSSWTSGTISGTGDQTGRVVQCVAYSGCNPSDPIDTSRGAQGTGGTSNPTDTVANIYGNGWAVAAFANRAATLGTWTAAGLTERVDSNVDGGTEDTSNAMYDSAAAVALGGRSYTGTSSVTSLSRGAWLGILKPAGDSPSSFPVRIGTETSNSTATNGNLTIAYPAGSVAGDLIVLAFNSGRTSTGAYTVSSINGPSWTLLESLNATADSGLRWDIYWAIRGSETSVSITHSVSSSFRGVFGRTVAYSQDTIDTSAPIDTSAINAAVTSGSATAPTITTGFNNVEVLGMAFCWRSGTGTAVSATWNNSFTEITDESTASNSSYRVNLNSAIRQFPTASTATGNCTITWSPSTSIAARGGAQVSIKPPQNQTKGGSDSAGATETGAVAATLAASDGAGVTETRVVAAAVPSSDSAGVAESARISVAVSDVAGATDVSVPIGHDMFGATETQSSTAVVAASDSAGITETISVANAVNASDSAGVAESISGIAMSASDTAGASDSVVPVGYDQAGVSETVSTVGVPVSDSAGATETAAAAVNTAASDSAGVVDAAALRVSVSDAAGAAESQSTTATVPVSDAAGVTDTARVAPAAQSDSAGVAESVRLSPAAQSDSVGVTESAIVTVSVFASDAAGVTESQPSIVFAAVSDSFGWDDTVAYRLSDQLQGLPRVRVAEREDRIRSVAREPRMLKPDADVREQVTDRESRWLKVSATVATFDVEAGN